MGANQGGVYVGTWQCLGVQAWHSACRVCQASKETGESLDRVVIVAAR